ncbi:hypothetical protein [Nostoc sp.]|uniref:hypothetical protein n=1 Tax=Nostoc sp. TaxID=1180 RepID=UPI002FF4A330
MGLRTTDKFQPPAFFTTDDCKIIQKYAAVCLETQYFPNYPNESAFPSAMLHPGENIRQ